MVEEELTQYLNIKGGKRLLKSHTEVNSKNLS